jgi:hypothetical protein
MIIKMNSIPSIQRGPKKKTEIQKHLGLLETENRSKPYRLSLIARNLPQKTSYTRRKPATREKSLLNRPPHLSNKAPNCIT